MGFFSWFKSSKPKRLPEGYVKTVKIKELTVFICGKNHKLLERSGRLGGTLKYNDVVWLRGYRKSNGLITVKPDDKIIAHEFRRVLHNNDKEMINANQTDEL